MFKKKKITNCKKCNKLIEKNEETYHDLCFECYKEYLLEKIEHLDENNFEKNNPKNIFEYIKNIFGLN